MSPGRPARRTSDNSCAGPFRPAPCASPRLTSAAAPARGRAPVPAPAGSATATARAAARDAGAPEAVRAAEAVPGRGAAPAAAPDAGAAADARGPVPAWATATPGRDTDRSWRPPASRSATAWDYCPAYPEPAPPVTRRQDGGEPGGCTRRPHGSGHGDTPRSTAARRACDWPTGHRWERPPRHGPRQRSRAWPPWPRPCRRAAQPVGPHPQTPARGMRQGDLCHLTLTDQVAHSLPSEGLVMRVGPGAGLPELQGVSCMSGRALTAWHRAGAGPSRAAGRHRTLTLFHTRTTPDGTARIRPSRAGLARC